MPGSDRPNVLKVAQSVPGAWPTIPALTRLMSSQATFEPVSAKTQPVSGHTTCQIPDIENSCSRDSSGKTPPSVGSARFSSPKTRPLPANPRECRRFSHTWKSHRGDRTGWLGRQDSNLGMAESKSTYSAFDFKGHSEKSANFDPFPINRLDADSECATGAAQVLWGVLTEVHATLSKQHSPTPQREAEHPEQRRHHVDSYEHAKHQRVVEEGRGVPIDRDRRD